jgi:hypothetical protein
MNDFYLWLSMGFWHIADLQAFDHILFVALLVFAFPLNEWRKLLALITAFTFGHSLSLALSVSGIIRTPSILTELLIALTIISSAIYQLLKLRKESPQKMPFVYGTVTFFGLIHGMGFSYLLNSLLGKEESVLSSLLYFNIGIEAGQILIVTLLILFSLLLTHVFKLPFKQYKQISLCIIALTALKMCVERSLVFFQS